jgi:MFS family permease
VSETIGTPTSIPARHVAAVVLGNALEFYDFLTYSSFSVYIGKTFFPSDDPSLSLLASLATFGVGFATRPVGGFIIGNMADRIGRKPAMILSFTLMGIGIIGLALTPSYATIGVAAPILAICFRLIQGFALGGEVGPTTAFMIEAAPPNRRGFYAAMQAWSQDLAVMAASIVGFILASVMTTAELQDWGWRIALLIGATIVPFGLALRRNLPETFSMKTTGEKRAPIRPHLRVAILGLMLLASGTIASYVLDYMTTYAIDTLQMPATVAFEAGIIVGVTGVLFDLVSGLLSDRFGRRLVMLVPATLLFLLILPSFYFIEQIRSPEVLLAATAVLGTLAAIANTPIVIWLTESLPASIRAGGVAIVYATSIAIFGGSTQFTIKALIHLSGNPIAPAYYWMFAAAVGLTAMYLTHESAPVKTKELASQPAE